MKSFFLFLILIFILVILLEFLPVYEVNSQEQVESLPDNTRISTAGTVKEEKQFGKNSLLILENNIEVICSCKEYYKGKKIEVIGYKDSLTKKITALEIITKLNSNQ